MHKRSQVAIRVDSSNLIGGGHVYRSLFFAQALRKRGIEVTFFCRNLKGNLNSIIISNGFNLKIFEKKFQDQRLNPYKEWSKKEQIRDAHFLNKYSYKFDYIFSDHYGLAYSWEKHISFDGKLIVLDDFINKNHFCDYYINFHTKKISLLQKRIKKKNCKFLLGKKYLIIAKKNNNESFAYYKDKKKILIYFGTSDTKKITLRVTKTIIKNNYNNLNFLILVGQNNKDVDKIKRIIKRNKNITLIKNIINFNKIYKTIKFTIGTHGQNFFERIFNSVPSIVILHNRLIKIDQRDFNNKCIKFLYLKEIKLLKLFIKKFSKQKLIFNGRKFVDGKGIGRILKAIK